MPHQRRRQKEEEEDEGEKEEGGGGWRVPSRKNALKYERAGIFDDGLRVRFLASYVMAIDERARERYCAGRPINVIIESRPLSCVANRTVIGDHIVINH